MKPKNKFEKIKEFAKAVGKAGEIGLGVDALEGASSRYVAGWLEVVDLPLRLPRLDDAFSGYRIAQISDIHFGSWIDETRLKHVVDAALMSKPDVTVLTGDYFCETEGEIKRRQSSQIMSAALQRLSAEMPLLAVMGNHDYWIDLPAARKMLVEGGALELENNIYSVKRDGAELHLCGVDSYSNGYSDLGLVLEKLPQAGAAILLAHEPDLADESAATGRFDLQISGHSHGGQIVLKNEHIFAAPRFGQKYPLGLYQVGQMQQYTSRGVGTGRAPVRYNCPPEVTIFTLQH